MQRKTAHGASTLSQLGVEVGAAVVRRVQQVRHGIVFSWEM